jgi:four helix bundle protein
MPIKSFRDLQVWQAGMHLCSSTYQLVRKLPKSEQFGLISQMQRASVSVPANIAEGYHRQSDRELCRFLLIAMGSLAELQTYMYLCIELEYVKAESLAAIFAEADETAKMLHGFLSKAREALAGNK